MMRYNQTLSLAASGARIEVTLRRLLTLSIAWLSLLACGDDPTGLDDAPGLIFFSKHLSGLSAAIWVMRPDGSDARQLTSSEFVNVEPHSSPDGLRIVFASFRDSTPADPLERSEIYIMNADGSDVQKLTDGELAASSPRWSPDATEIAFTRRIGADQRRIFVMNPDGSNVRILPPLIALYPDWSPDGTRILFIANADWELHVMNADGTGVQPLGGDAACPGSIRGARWSPDGTRIVYMCEAVDGYSIYTMRANGADIVKVRPATSGSRAYGIPVWSPDGRLIAFGREGSGTHDVFIMDSRGRNETRITNDVALDVVSDWNDPR